jgi:hypothetical protein
MPYAVDLTTLTDLKNYISPTLAATTASDSILAKTITAVSSGINRYLARTLAVSEQSEVRNGNGRDSIRTLVYPILGVTSAVISSGPGVPGQTINPTSGPPSGPYLTNDNWFIYLRGADFCEGRQNITLNYTAGFITPGQLQVLALPVWVAGTYTLQNQQVQVAGFYYTAINTGTTGASAPTWGTIRNSITVDNGVSWLCNGPIPVLTPTANIIDGDFQQACMQQAALLFKNRTRVGDTGSGVGPDRVNYFLKGAHPSTIDLINPHREVFPIDGMGPV